MKKSNKKGFTLVELVVVIAIIGILAAILVPSMMNYVKKSKLKSANANAKLVYTTVNNQAADLISDGKDTSTIVDGPVCEVSALDQDKDNSPLTAAVYNALKDNGDGAGWCYWTVDATTKDITLAQWCSTDAADQIVGQYPNPEDDADVMHTLGTSF